MSDQGPVFIVDDDADVRDSLRALLESAGFEVEDYDSAMGFLGGMSSGRGSCLVADIRMPDMDGLTLQEELVKRQADLPVIIVTGHGDVPLAVRAMKAGAIDFIEKPYDDELLLSSVRRAREQSLNRQAKSSNAKEAETRVASLTAREREVLEHLVAGQPNKVIAHELGISPRTVEIHRAHLMEKMQARSLSDLVRLALTAGVQAPGV
ncbi:response regulator FixJ [Parvibaculum sp.]|uniref:response regulator FixJ n=1 Tax=Parvibaculum sp. TaxID=2024848 RepID=UPI002C24F210|nr:response regulator FixJ [Parvibaculum sp.]HUD51374.1 response regulator FixJ [Parvibaculum sp.]